MQGSCQKCGIAFGTWDPKPRRLCGYCRKDMPGKGLGYHDDRAGDTGQPRRTSKRSSPGSEGSGGF